MTPTEPLDLDGWSQRCDRAEENGDPVTMGWRTLRALIAAARQLDAVTAERDSFMEQIAAYHQSSPYFEHQSVMERENALIARIAKLEAALTAPCTDAEVSDLYAALEPFGMRRAVDRFLEVRRNALTAGPSVNHDPLFHHRV